MPDYFVVWELKTRVNACGPFDSKRECQQVLRGEYVGLKVPRRAEAWIVRASSTADAIARMEELGAPCSELCCQSSSRYRVIRGALAGWFLCPGCTKNRMVSPDDLELLHKGVTKWSWKSISKPVTR